MIDVSVKFAVVAAVATVATWRVTPVNAAAARRVWLAVACAPVLGLAAGAFVEPIAYLRPRPGIWPALALTPSDATIATLWWIYGAVAGALLLRSVAGIASVRRLIRRSRPVGAEELARLQQVAGASIAIREADLHVPVTAGFVRPVVILPESWRSLPAAALGAILRHEAAHVRRHDCAVALAGSLLEAAFWFNPAAWMTSARLRWFAELACDAEASRGLDGREYAAQLLALAAGWRGARRPLYAITAGAETAVARRIHLLLDELERGSRRRRLLPALVVFVVVSAPAAAALGIGTGAAASAAPDTHAGHDRRHAIRHQH